MLILDDDAVQSATGTCFEGRRELCTLGIKLHQTCY